MPSTAIRPSVFTRFSEIAAAQSTRLGGVSTAPYNSLNLGKSTADDPETVAENRRRICASLDFLPPQMALCIQVHGDQICLAEKGSISEGFDALISRTPGVLLAVSVADCTPILVYDPVQKAVTAIHAGWRGTVSGIVSKTLQEMQTRFGTRGEHCFAYIGACIDACSFEVGDEVAEHFDAAFKYFDVVRGKFMVDLKKANATQLAEFGVPAPQIEVSPYCTVQRNDLFFSHRKEGGVTGRGMGLIGLRARTSGLCSENNTTERSSVISA